MIASKIKGHDSLRLELPLYSSTSSTSSAAPNNNNNNPTIPISSPARTIIR